MALSMMFRSRVSSRQVAQVLCTLQREPRVVTTRSCSQGSTGDGRDLVETERIGHVYLVGINRPEVRNCVDFSTAARLREEFQNFEKDDSLWVAVLYGKGGCFCGGFDLKALANLDANEFIKQGKDATSGPMGPSKIVFSKPVIAAVNGYAVAGGMELALMCDLRVMEDTAKMGVFCRRWGVPLIDGGTVRLQKLVGLSRAMDLILTGRPITAKEAGEAGLANRVVPPGTAVGEAVKLAQSICTHPQECLRADRRSAYYAAYEAKSLSDAMEYEWKNGLPIVEKESVKGAQRFKDGAGRHGIFEQPPKHKL